MKRLVFAFALLAAPLSAQTYQRGGTATIVFDSASAPIMASPVTDLTATSFGTQGILLQWTEVDGGDGGPADYIVTAHRELQFPWLGEPFAAFLGNCAPSVSGIGIGNSLGCVFEGLATGVYRFEIYSVPDASGFVPPVLTLDEVDLDVTTDTLPRGQVGIPYSHFLRAVGGDGTYRWRLIDELPQGWQASTVGGRDVTWIGG